MNAKQLQQQLTLLQIENKLLQNQVNKQKEIKDTLNTILEGTAALTGAAFFECPGRAVGRYPKRPLHFYR